MTTPTTTAGSAGLLWPATVEAPSSGWDGPISGHVGTIPWGGLQRVIEYIQQNLDQDLTLAELAAVVYMSPYHFARLFKRSTGMPPQRFVIRQRITRACAILAAPEPFHHADLADGGFRTPSHFTTVCRHVTGMTPKG